MSSVIRSSRSRSRSVMIRREQPVTILRSVSLVISKVTVTSPAKVEENDNGENKKSGNDSSYRESNEFMRSRFWRRRMG